MRFYEKMLLNAARYAASFLGGVLLVASNPVQAADVTISGINFSNNNGKALFLMFSEENKNGFPDQAEQSICGDKPKINNQQTVVVCKNLRPGIYAAVFVHDENDNGRVDKNFLGFPSEDYGISNNPFRLGPIPFQKAGFKVGEEDLEITIELD